MIEVEPSSASLTVDERLDFDSHFVQLCLELKGVAAIGAPFTVEMQLDEEVSTATLGEDLQYDLIEPTLPAASTSVFIDFASGTELRSCSEIFILSDDVLEGDETYVLRISNSRPYSIAINSNQDSSAITINNDPGGRFCWCSRYT